MTDRKWELVTVVHDPILAEILKGLLEAQGLMIHIVREGYQSAFGITNQPSVHIELLAPNDQIEEARQVIEDYNAGKFEEE
ncbi:MAG: putative signal transducing protein [Anaerolineales bacterium]